MVKIRYLEKVRNSKEVEPTSIVGIFEATTSNMDKFEPKLCGSKKVNR